MAKTPKRIFIKPMMVDCGRGPQAATVPYPRVVGGRLKVLPAEGETVSMEGTSGSYWTRRINEGSVEQVEQPKRVQPKQPADRKKDGN